MINKQWQGMVRPVLSCLKEAAEFSPDNEKLQEIIYSKRQKYLYFRRLLAPTACRKAAKFLIRSRVHPPEGYSKRHFFMSFTIII